MAVLLDCLQAHVTQAFCFSQFSLVDLLYSLSFQYCKFVAVNENWCMPLAFLMQHVQS
jgi:hypothetical protein